MSFLWSLGAFIIVIAVLVAVHEYGHFWAARKCGIKVQRFSIGFGKVIWSRKDKQGTEFAVSLIPLGGYVKMLDERNESVPEQLKSQAFNHKTVAQRAFVIAAGPLANFLFAIFAYWVIYLIGIPTIKPVIEQVQPQSLAAQADIRPDNQIMAIDGSKTPDWETVNMLLATKMGSQQVAILLKDIQTGVEKQKIINLANWRFDPDKESAFSALGIEPMRTKVSMILSNVIAGSPADQAGLMVGDNIVAVGQQKVDWQQFVQRIQDSNGQPLPITFERHGDYHQIEIVPEKNQQRWFVGLSPTVEPIADEYRTELKYGMLESLQKGLEKTIQLCWITIKVIGKLFTGDLSLNNLSGPISIAKGAGISSEIGFVYYLSFMALISVNLGIMNLFPLPVLDGGHLVFLAAEAIRGKPLSARMQEISYRIGATLLLMLTFFAIFNDFLRL
ncbi:sigma E protease regulator RseP [Volucribacter amazonae]|uniref:Zinc metalloprotease n=1 Tax=Volucribacter amazonae TaxID=256731 RepID=A0A9X4PAZ1_9PAST|nr:sigma E protease regulator RseP [Volucribacter amazonae]MDG6894937.1 zinc metallopeptidase RseP [Volucribacter amazonae]